MSEEQNVEMKPRCPKCGSTNTYKHGWKILRGGVRKQMRKCKKCGHIWY